MGCTASSDYAVSETGSTPRPAPPRVAFHAESLATLEARLAAAEADLRSVTRTTPSSLARARELNVLAGQRETATKRATSPSGGEMDDTELLQMKLKAAEVEQERLRATVQRLLAAAEAADSAAAKSLALSLAPLAPVEYSPTPDECASRVVMIDAFISHSGESSELACTLNTELKEVVGLRCFMNQDMELEPATFLCKVRASKALVFILSDHVLESARCALELREALIWGVEVIIVKMQGTKWMVGGKMHDFPPSYLIRPEIASAFANRNMVIDYNRNSHETSVDQLLQRMHGQPVRAALAQWQVPDQPEPSLVLEDLTARDSKWKLDLPPLNPLQLLDGISGWQVASHADPFRCSSLANLRAVPAQHMLATDTGIHGGTFSVLAIDGASCFVQTGRLDRLGNASFDSATEHVIEFATPFRDGARPEVFVALSGHLPSSRPGLSGDLCQQFILRAENADERGFEMFVSPMNESTLSSRGPTTLAEVSISWLAFDPRLNHAWVHGEVWLDENDLTDPLEPRLTEVRFTTGASSTSVAVPGNTPVPRTAFTAPPLVFVAVGGLAGSTRGLGLSLQTSSVSTSGFSLVAHLTRLAAASAEDSAPLKTSSPIKLCVRWLALPAGPPPAPPRGARRISM